MKKVYFYDFSIGSLGIVEKNNSISGIFFNNSNTKGKISKDFEKNETPLIKKAALQLEEYFNLKRKVFDLPLLIEGTEFQRSVWNSLLTIPYGQTCSYKDIASRIGNHKACRAVGMANNRNPIVIIVPCHRVIGQNGSLTGYGGGLKVKQFLLEMEKN